MSEEEANIAVSDDLVHNSESENISESEAYNVEDRDQNEVDDDIEEANADQEQAQDFAQGTKRPIGDVGAEDGLDDLQDNPAEELANKRSKTESEVDKVPEDKNEDDDEELNEGEDEDEDEDEDDEEESEGPTKAKKKRRRANQFIDIEAEVDEEEEEELDEEDEEAELLREQFISDDRVETVDGNDKDHHDDRLHREFDRRRQEAEDQDAEQLAETLKQRYRKTHSVYRGDTATSGAVSQKLLMPSINDPSIYAIRCTPGREKELVRKLYEKKRTLERSNKPLDILTVFQRDAFRGYIYIEAKRAEAIDRALSGMVNIFARNRLLVPVREYPDLLKQVKSSDVEIVPGIYVRITRGKYKNDLAIVDNLSENGLDVRCKLVPRLDYGKNDEFDREGRRIKSKSKPPPRLFSEQEARIHSSEYLQPGRGPRSFIYRGDEYNDGFLFKDFKLQYIQTKDVHPSLEELDRFQAGNDDADGLDLSAIAASLKNKNGAENNQSSAFQPGDKVEIRRGELARTVGKVLSSSLNEINLLVLDSGDPKFVNQNITAPASDLRKIFNAGDHVKIIEGKHSEETGLVIKIDGDSVVLLSDQTKQDIRVFANYLIKATDTSSNTDSMSSNYDTKDLVQLNASTVGVIIRADKGIVEILATDGRILDVKPSGIASKLELSRREQVATDKNGLTIRVGDTVKELTGEKKREGTILHIYKNALFIKSNEIIENLGIFVSNCNSVSTITTKGSIVSKNLGPDLTRMNPNLKMPNAIATAGLKTKVGGRDKLIYKDVVITGGNHKGLMGKVTDADETFARIELHTKSKKIKVNKNNLSVLIRGEAIPYLRFIGANASQEQQFKPSAPAFSSGGRSSWNTPAAGNGATSSWGNGGGSSWGGGTSWGGGKTPAYSSSGGASTWGGATAWGGGKTPGGNSAWGGNGGNSTWGSNGANGGNSTWGSNGGNSSAWGNRGGKSTWGSGSSWGGK